MKKQACPHGQTSSCTQCSGVKLVAYLQDNTKIVWYSYFREDRLIKSSAAIAVQMGTRMEKKYGKRIKKMLFFNNKTGAEELIAEN